MGTTEGKPTGRTEPTVALKLGGIGIGLTIAGVLASGFGSFVVGFVSTLAVGDPTGLLWFSVAVLTVAELGYFVAGYAYARFRDLPVPLSEFTGGDARATLVGTIAALVVGIGLFSLLAVVDLQPQTFYVEEEPDSATFLATAAVFVLVAPPAEEYLFRGAIQGRFRETVGAPAAIAGSGLLFGAIHFFNYIGSALSAMIAGALVLTLVGAIFGAVYERTNNLLVPIAVHTGYNLVLMAVSATAFF